MMDAQAKREVSKIGTHYGGVDGFLSVYSDSTKQAARKLIADSRMSVYWGSKFTANDFEEAVHIFELAGSRQAWDGLSKKAQEEWLRKFDKTLSALFQLLETAPHPPERWGFPVRDVVLAEAARRMGAGLPEDSEDFGLFRAALRLEPVVDAMNWTIVDSLKHFQRQQHIDATIEQRLAKPMDAKAPRAYFLNHFQVIRPEVSATVVATVASLLFNEDVDDRTVRQHRPDGLLKKSENPS